MPTCEHLAAQVEQVKAYVTSSEAVEKQIDTLETVLDSCRKFSGVQSVAANNLTVSLLSQLRFSTAAMFLTHEELINKPLDYECVIPTVL